MTPQTPEPSGITQLSELLCTVNEEASTGECTRLSEAVFLKTMHLTREFGLTSPPLWHNTLVNLGLREKGLCYHWSDALYRHLSSQGYRAFGFHLAGANIGGYFTEHNALVIVKKGQEIQKGVVIDPWRNSGKLYFSKVSEDKKYTWTHRPERGCESE